MAVLIDTDVLVDVERGGSALDELVPDEERAIGVITVSELLRGAHRGGGREATRRLAFAEHVLGSLAVVPVSTPVARLHARIHADLAAAGDVIGAHDLWIAATAISYGIGVATGTSATSRGSKASAS